MTTKECKKERIRLETERFKELLPMFNVKIVKIVDDGNGDLSPMHIDGKPYYSKGFIDGEPIRLWGDYYRLVCTTKKKYKNKNSNQQS